MAERLHRFIPACTGNSQLRTMAHRRLSSVHPRVYGELTRSLVRGQIADTVHPRVYGELCRASSARCTSARFIPACTGNSLSTDTGDQHRVAVHPRVYGELARRTSGTAFPRFIPACTGNSLHRPLIRHLMSGSSPRVRGTLFSLSSITPITCNITKNLPIIISGLVVIFWGRIESTKFKPIQNYRDATIRSTGIKIQAQVIWFGPDNHGIAFTYFIVYHLPCPLADSL